MLVESGPADSLYRIRTLNTPAENQLEQRGRDKLATEHILADRQPNIGVQRFTPAEAKLYARVRH